MTTEPAHTSNPQPTRARLLRRLTGTAIKPFFQPWVPVPAKRHGLWLASRTTPAVRGITINRARVGQVAVEELRRDNHAEHTLIYLHGGAYCVGSPATHRAITSRLARTTGARVLAVDYRLAPESPFPAAVDDALSVYQALLADGVPADRIALVGDSAGGGLSVALAMAARGHDLPLPAALWLMSPWIDLTLANAGRPAPHEYMLSWPGLARSARLYAPGATDNPLASPLRGDLEGLPPVLLQVGSEEILLAEAQQLSEKARHAGVDTRLEIFDGFWHVFQVQAGLLSVADEALTQGCHFLTGHLTDT